MRRVFVCLLWVLSVWAWNGLSASAQAIQYTNSGWDLFPEARNQVWTTGNTTGYFEGESIPFRGDIDVEAGVTIFTSIRYDRLLETGPGNGRGFHAIDFLESPLSPENSIPDRALPVDYPSADPTSTAGPFVCWGGTIELLEEAVPAAAPGPEQELRYKVRIVVTDPVPTLKRTGVVIGFAAHLAESEKCNENRRRTTCQVYGASFWPGSRIHVCLDRPSYTPDDSDNRMAAKCVPIPVAFRPAEVRVKEFLVRIPQREWDAVVEENSARDPTNPLVWAALWTRDDGATWVCVPLDETGSGQPPGIWDSFDTGCPPEDDMVVLKGTEILQCPSTISWTVGLIEQSSCSAEMVSPADIRAPQDGGVPFCEGSGDLGPFHGILGPEEIPCGDGPFVNFCEPPLRKHFEVTLAACDCSEAVVTVDYDLAHRGDEARESDSGTLTLTVEDPEACRFEGSLSPVHQGDRLTWQVQARSPAGLFPDVALEERTETICDESEWSMVNPAEVPPVDKAWRLKVDNHCTEEPAVVKAEVVYYLTNVLGERQTPDLTLELGEVTPSSGVWEFEEKLCLSYLVYKYVVELADGTARETGLLGGDPSDCLVPPPDGAGCGVPFTGANPEAICHDVTPRVDPGCLEIPVRKIFCATVEGLPEGGSVIARWKFCDETEYVDVPLIQDPVDAGRWCGDDLVDLRDSLDSLLDIGDGYDCIDVEFALLDASGSVDVVFGAQRDEQLCGLERLNEAQFPEPPEAFPRTIGYWGTWASHLNDNRSNHFSLESMVKIAQWVSDNEVCDNSSRVWSYVDPPDCGGADDPGIYRLQVSESEPVAVDDIHRWLLEEQSNSAAVGQLRAQSLGVWLNAAAAELTDVSTRSGNPVGVPLDTRVFVSKIPGHTDGSLNPLVDLGATPTVRELLCGLDAAAVCNPDNPWADWTPNQRSFLKTVFEGINTGLLLEP